MLAIAGATAAVAVAVGASAIDRLHPYSAADPDSESVRAAERVFAEIGLDPDAGIVALIDLPADPDSERSQERVDDVARRIFLQDGVGFVSSYYTTGDRAMVSRDGSQAFVVAYFETLSDRRQQLAAERLHERFAGDPGVSFGGEAPANVEVADIVVEDIARAELIAFPLLLALGFWFFRGLVAALLPLVVGAFATAFALAGLRLANELVDVSVFALNLVLGLALALAVDYSLLIVSRYREELARHPDRDEALRATIRSAGRTVLFSSTAIAAAMAALLVFPQRFLYSMGIGGIVVGIAAGAAALLVLPAVLAVLGERVNALAPRRLQQIAARQAQPERSGGWYRLARFVMRRPVPIAIACATVLIALGIPFLSARYTPVDTAVLPDGAESREVRETLETRFPPNLTLPLFAVVDGASRHEASAVAAEIRELPGTARVDDPRRAAGVQVIDISPSAGPRSVSAESLVDGIRAIDTPGELLLGGRAADYVDQKESIASHLPLALILLFVPTILVLFVMTGSVLLPLKAVLMNVVTITAALGLLVLIFQDGRLEGLLGIRQPRRPRSLPAAGAAGGRVGDLDRLRRLPAGPDQGGARRGQLQRRGGGAGPGAHRPRADGGGAADLRRARGLRDLADRLHQGARARARGGGADRRDDRPGAVRALADGPARRLELVGAGAAAAPAWRPYSTTSSIAATISSTRSSA